MCRAGGISSRVRQTAVQVSTSTYYMKRFIENSLNNKVDQVVEKKLNTNIFDLNVLKIISNMSYYLRFDGI